MTFAAAVLGGLMVTKLITGTEADPELISKKDSGVTFVADIAASAVQLPGAPLVPDGAEFTFSTTGSGTLVLLPFNGNTIQIGDKTTTNTGYLYLSEAGTTVTIRSVNGAWNASAAVGFVQFGALWGGSPTNIVGALTSARTALRSIQFPAVSLSLGARSSAPTANALGLAFANGATNDIGTQFALPTDYASYNTHLHYQVYVHWMKSTSAAGTVKWQMRERHASSAATNGDLTAFTSWVDFATTVYSDGDTAERQAAVSFATISIPASSPRRMVVLEIRRLSSGGSADTYGAPAYLVSIEVEYPSDVPGTIQ